jgi:hypothetical protein
MAPSYWDNYTYIGDWNTDSTITRYKEYSYDTSYEIKSYVDIENSEEYQQKMKKIIRKAIIQKMKDGWQEIKKEFKFVPKMRPNVQLRGVCFNGRGWA